MKRLFAIIMTAMMVCGLSVVSISANNVISPELKRTVDIGKEVIGDKADDYADLAFGFELDVSKLTFEDNRWEQFAADAGITYNAERNVLIFTLKAGEEISLDLPFGDDYLLSEIGGYDNEDYTFTTINGVETRDFEFDVAASSVDIDVVNAYGDAEKPGVGDGDDPGSEGSETPGSENPGTPGSPQTGYTIGIVGLTAAAAASGAVAVFTGKKAKKR